MKFSNRRVFFVFIGKTSYSFLAVVFRSLLCIRTDFHDVMRFTASHWFTDSIYPFKRFVFLLLFPKTEYCLSPFKKMKCFDKKRSNKFLQNCAGCRRPNGYTFSSASFNFTFVTFMLSFAATLCFCFIIKVTFLFFYDDLFREYCSL